MAYKIIKTEPSLIGEISRPVIMAVLDSDDDLAALGNNYGASSVAIVADKGAPVYMLNASGVWKEI